MQRGNRKNSKGGKVMLKGYTSEKNIQILIALMKKHGVRKVVASPGTTNACFVASIQQDNFFQIYSSVDERSAAYLACGLSEESGEPVALSCTGATASRNYLSGLTEAYYRKIPILAITSTPYTGRIGNNIPQVIDRSAHLNDTQLLSVELPFIDNGSDEWYCCLKTNEALLELRHRGGGPVHINLETKLSPDYSCMELPDVRMISRIYPADVFPQVPDKKIAIFVGSHKVWTDTLTKAVDKFCETYNAVVLYDHTSNYTGKYGVLANLVTNQEGYKSSCLSMDLLIHIGDVSGAYMNLLPEKVWRVSPDGAIRDTFYKLENIFEMTEEYFFSKYISMSDYPTETITYYKEWKKERELLFQKIPELPLSNIWIAQQMCGNLPHNSVIHFAILNSLRSWNYFEISNTIRGYANTGGFGIDGCVSSLIGASLIDSGKIYFGIVGDLALFYDLNSVGNRHIGKNLRLLVINNGRGIEFENYNHYAARFGEDADAYIAAAGHFGNKSDKLLKHYAEDLGFMYLSASTKDEVINQLDSFISGQQYDQPILFEIFTEAEEESRALKLINSLNMKEEAQSRTVKTIIKNILGDTGVQAIKRIIRNE